MVLDSARWCHCGPTASAHSWAVRHGSSCTRVFAVFVFLVALNINVHSSNSHVPPLSLSFYGLFLKFRCKSGVETRGNQPTRVLCVLPSSPRPSSLHFPLTSSVPPSVPHRSAHPPLLPDSLQLLHPQPHFPARTVSSSSSSSFFFFYILLPRATCQGLSLPWASEFAAWWQTECVRQRAGAGLCSGTCCGHHRPKRFTY